MGEWYHSLITGGPSPLNEKRRQAAALHMSALARDITHSRGLVGDEVAHGGCDVGGLRENLFFQFGMVGAEGIHRGHAADGSV